MTLRSFSYFSSVKQGLFKNAYWSLILLLAFAAIQLLPALFQPVHQFIYYKQQAELAQMAISNGSLESLRMSDEMFASIDEDEQEITWNGTRYDIKAIHHSKGIVELLVKRDTLETSLNSLVQIIEASAAKDNNPNTVQHFYTFYFENIVVYQLVRPICSSTQLPLLDMVLESNVSVVSAPPPRV